MPKRDFVDFDVVGDSFLSEKQTLAWKICNFADLEHKKGEKVTGIGSLQCHGRSWSLILNPRGDRKAKDGHVSIFLVLDGGEKVKAKFTIRVGDHQKKSEKSGSVFNCKGALGFIDFCKRDHVVTLLEEGNLLIEVDIELFLDKTEHVKPRRTLSDDLLKMLSSGKGSDVTFVVGGKRFTAHYNILAFRAPTLAELAEDNKNNGTEIVIDGVDAEMFSALLRNVYGDEDPPAELLEGNARDMLDMADRFGCTNLKLLAESKVVESGIKAETAADLLLFAHGNSCASLKEATMSFIKANAAAVAQTPEWKNVKESATLLSELFETALIKASPAKDSGDVNGMTVAALRRELQKKKLSEDGTREILVKRLKKSVKKRRTKT